MNNIIFKVCKDVNLNKITLFEKSNDTHYLQSLQWLKFHNDSFIASSYKEGKCVALSIVRNKILPMRLGTISYIDRGPVGESLHNVVMHMDEVINYLSNKNTLSVNASPMMYGFDNIEKLAEKLKGTNWIPQNETVNLYKNTLVIDLGEPIDKIRSEFRRSLKTQINKSNKLGIVVDFEPDSESINEFINDFNVMASDRGIMAIDIDTSNFIKQSISDGTAKVITAILEGKLIGGIVLMKQGDRMIYEWGMTSPDPKYKTIPLAHKIHWEAINWSKKNGYKIYDFGGYWLERGNDDPINYFKLGFTKEVEAISPEYIYYIRPVRSKIFKVLNKLRKYLK